MKALKTKPQNKKCPVVLAIYPHGRGLAHAVMDSPTNIVESGIKHYSRFLHKKILSQASAYLEYYRPDIVILRNIPQDERNSRINSLIERINQLALEKQLNVACYTRNEIEEVFTTFDARNKHEIYGVITLCFPEYTDKRPKERELGDPEPYRSGEFDAISLAYTHMFRIS